MSDGIRQADASICPPGEVAAQLAPALAEGGSCSLAFAQAGTVPLVLAGKISSLDGGLRIACASSCLSSLHGRVSIDAAVTVNCRAGTEDLFFCSRLERFESGTDAGEVFLRLEMPREVVATQRRKSFRLRVTPEDAVGVRLWRLEPYAVLRDQPKPSQSLQCELYDLSTGGMRALVRATRVQALALAQDQRFRVELSAGGSTSMLFEGRLRYPRQTHRDDAEVVCGIRFTHRDGDIESRRNLQKLQVVLGHLQRQAAARRSAVA